ncbi:TetR/AcrR family transcriptional regulator [Nocardia jinanensis]|uniref:TetR/AcrR family transcriptional regulator n=1 Tax=Nocardia jinanensis TaxID=382504 RepID=UPI0009EB7CB0|nr:TetR/AcrR family transcriptional regulator [Nocardia jinanensis]
MTAREPVNAQEDSTSPGAATAAGAQPEPAVPGRSPRPAPKSRRGIRTRAALVAAAREVFEADGFVDARISDITRTAGVASGSFYTHFDSKEGIFAEVVEQVREEMLHPHVRARGGSDDPRDWIAAANREYLKSYRRNARLMAVLEQVSRIDQQFAALRAERASAFIDRNAALIRDLQNRGLVTAKLDARVTALALSSMVSKVAYLVFVEGEKIEFDTLLETLDWIWCNALQLPGSADEAP